MSTKRKILAVSLYLLIGIAGLLGGSRVSWWYLIGSQPPKGCPIAR